jgi:hypothetical protein
MQNRYVADVGDFGKYGLLRWIARANLRLGVNWYLTPDESHNQDGKHLSYLKNEIAGFKECDEALFRCLFEIVENDLRAVESVRKANILPADTVFYNEVLDLSMETQHAERSRLRQVWHKRALQSLENCEIIFLDPDYGLEVSSVTLTSRKGNKYVGCNELEDYFVRQKSVILYNHRERKREDIYLDKFRRLKQKAVYQAADVFGLKFLRGTLRDYIFLLQPEHAEKVKRQCDLILETAWNRHFVRLPV